MSHRMSRKAQLFAQLAKDEKFKDAFNLIAASLVNNPELSTFSLGDYLSDDSEEEDISDDDILEDEVTDEDQPPELCTDCKCGKKSVGSVTSKTGTKTISKCQLKATNKSDNILKKLKQKLDPMGFEDSLYDSDENDEGSDCDDCQDLSLNDKKVDELTEEEKRKKRNEKKKLQKKKKRDKRKAEKQSSSEPSGGTKSEANRSNDNKNNNNKNNKKLENSNKNESNSNNTKNKHKSETKTLTKQKENQNNDKTDLKNKEIESKSSAKMEITPNGRNSRESLSVKSSPKSDRESDNVQSDVEEEELLLSSAYVAQIAQRKNKPTVYQKPAQTQNEAQECADESSAGAAKPKIFSDNNSNFSNNSDFVIKNNNNSQNNPNYNQNKTALSNNSREVDDFPKYKQYFFEKQKPMKGVSTQLTKEEKNQNVEKSVEMAILANHRAENNLFVEAIDLFSQAIAFNPKDYRFYVNRSYCYDSIQDFRNALKDAEIAIKLKPDWPKCHYRKGKALAGLKNYAESEIALKKVLTLESDCVEAIQDLRQVRYSAIVDMGYDTSTAELYSSNYESIKDALSALSLRQEKQKSLNTINTNNSNKTAIPLKKANNWWNSANNSKNGLEHNPRTGQTWDDDDIYISDDEFNSVREPTFEETSPTNPFGWKALWVGNVSLNAKLDTVTTMFRKYGNLNYCNIFKGNNGGNFILVHYDSSEAPTLAMSKYQGKVIPGVSIADTPLTIRFRPNKDQKKPNYDQRLESDECYYWRTTGCARGDNCLYKHIVANKGVDKQAWMCNPLRKNPFQKPQK